MQNNLFSRIFHTITDYFSLIFGHITWSCPPWLRYLSYRISSNSRIFLLFLFSALILLGTFYWYQKIPRPDLITAHITAPDITPLADELIPANLRIDFGIEKNSFINKSVAPLKLIGKEVNKGITITPAISGTWTWENGNHLTFTPNTDWPAGQVYTIDFKKDFFAPGTKTKSLRYTFSTQPFQATIAEFKFYQDPVNPQIRQAVATLNFNYPVNIKSLENKITLLLEAINNGKQNLKVRPFKFTITYDQHKRTAYLQSEQLPLPEVPRYLDLIVKEGVKPLIGPGSTTESAKQNILIPDAQSYFRISNVTANIVRNNRDQPEQVLAIETTLGITEATLNKNLHVFLLPKDYPATSVESAKPNYQWQNPGEITPDILALATPLILQTIPADRDYATLHSYKFNVETPQFIYVKIDKGAQAFGNYILANDYATITKAPNYPKEIGFLHKGALLAFSGEKKLSVTIRGLPAVKFTIARVLPDDINQLVTQTEGSFSDPRFLNYSFNKENISEIFSEIRQFDATDLAKLQYTALDLEKYLSAKSNSTGPLGLFLLQANGWDVEKKVPLNAETNRLILITDLGLLVKDNNDGSHDVFVQSITQGKPIANASVSILGKNGLPIVTGTTDIQGHVNFLTLKDFIEEREPTVYLARIGNDISFIPYKNSDRQLNYSRFDVGGLVTNHEEQSTLNAFIFSDRGIYRPRDTAHVGFVVKQAYSQAQPAGLPLQANITDPRGITVRDQKITLDETGYFTIDFQTTPTSPTGQYTVNLFIVKDNHPSSLLGSNTFQVAEFLPDRMHISANLLPEQREGWISPLGLKAKVNLMNLYGAPAADRKISARILLTPQAVKFNQFSQYTFIDPLLDPKKSSKVFTEILTDAKTNSDGQAEFSLNLERFDKATYQLTFFAEGFEAEGGRSVATKTTALVSPLAYLVGYKSDGDLKYIKQNSERNIHFIAINMQLKQQALTQLKMQLLQQHPVTTLVKNQNGTYQYQSLMQTTEVSNNTFSISEQGAKYTLPTDKMGDFVILITDQHGFELSRFNYTVVGQSQQTLPKNAELNVKLNKIEYLADQDIEMEIISPYTGTGLITIERDKVYAYQWFQTNTTTSIQKIHIPKDFQGGGYVSVAFVRDWNSPEIFISPLSYSTVPFTVNQANHTLKINLDVPELARPGTPLIMTYQSDKPGKIIVFAVDEGILQVTSYKTPDPLKFFFQKRALEVDTQQILDQILPQFIAARELSAVGGDAGESELGKFLNPFKRKTDLPVVYWSGVVTTDNTPRQLTYSVPDYFNGTLRIMAVAVAENAVGFAEKYTQIRGDFIINPNVPTFVAPNDEFEITASIANNVKGSGMNAPVHIQMKASPQLEILGASSQVLKINEGQEQNSHLKLRAKPQLGSAEITFLATMGDKSSKITATLSIRPASTYFTSISSDASSDAKKTLPLDRVMYPENRSVEAVISTSPLILVFGLQRYLDNFPYGCTEQLISKIFPLLAMADQPWFSKDTQALTNKIQTTIHMLSQRQLSNGGFSYWPSMGENSNNTFASVYAMHLLTEARSRGFDIPKDMFSNGISYLKELTTQNVSNMDEARIQAYAIYILTRNEIVTTNYLTHLQLYLEKDSTHAWYNDITNVYIASTYLLLKNYPDAERLMKKYQPQKESSNDTTDLYDKNIANAQYLYLIARHFPDYLPRLGDSLVKTLINALNSNEINTILSSYASLALTSYAQTYQIKTLGTFGISETLTDGKQKTLASADSLYQKVAITDVTRAVNFINASKQHYFYQLTQSGFDKNMPDKIIKKNLEIYREYRNSDQNVINTVNLGNEIEVHIQVRSLKDRYINNIAIVDLLPGGFEVVPDSIVLQNIDYADVREDRVIFFSGVGPDAKEIVYRIKATNTGNYIVPAIFATSMYDPNTMARGESGSIKIVK